VDLQKLFNPASIETFFSNFDQIFQYFPLRSLNMRSERKNFLSIPEVCFLDATRFVRLALTGVRVANFLNIAKYDLIFYTTLIYCLSVCLLVCLSFFSVLSVCLSVCLSYVHCTVLLVCTVFVNIGLSVHLYQYFCTVRLSVCLSVYVCTSLFLFVCMYICTSVFLNLCLSV
jgi:hypothetical protein